MVASNAAGGASTHARHAERSSSGNAQRGHGRAIPSKDPTHDAQISSTPAFAEHSMHDCGNAWRNAPAMRWCSPVVVEFIRADTIVVPILALASPPDHACPN